MRKFVLLVITLMATPMAVRPQGAPNRALELGDRIAVLNEGRLEQIGTPYDVYMKPATEYVATFLGAANLILGTVLGGRFEAAGISLELDESQTRTVREGQTVKLVFRPEDVFLRRPENLMQHYQELSPGTVEEVSFVGAFERLVVRLRTATPQSIIVTRPKTETSAFPLHPGDELIAGVVRFTILPSYALSSEKSGVMF